MLVHGFMLFLFKQHAINGNTMPRWNVLSKLYSMASLTLFIAPLYLSLVLATISKLPTRQLPDLQRLCKWAPGRPHALSDLLHHGLGDHRAGGRASERDVRPDGRRGLCGRHQLRCRHRGGLGHLQRRPGPLLWPLPLVHPGGKVGDRQRHSHALHTQAGTGV